MKTIGLLGGMSWTSTIEYYRIINEAIAESLGGLNSAKILLNSLNFAEVEKLQKQGDWDTAGQLLAEGAENLERAGADFIFICTNTMHKVADRVMRDLNVPLIHIADVTAEVIKSQGLSKIGLLGTRYTMEQDFLKQKLAGHGLDIIVPEAEDRDSVNRIIFEELCRGIIKEDSHKAMMDIIGALAAQGAEGVIFGCTEIALLVDPDSCSLPVFDTARIHAESAVKLALAE
ncbi:aspartate/glutamate racemase family protein [Paenibacillus sp. CAU 1782]